MGLSARAATTPALSGDAPIAHAGGMIVSRALAWACLTFLSGALAFVAALLIVLTIVQQLRGDAVAQPFAGLIGALVAAGLAYGCRAVAKRLT